VQGLEPLEGRQPVRRMNLPVLRVEKTTVPGLPLEHSIAVKAHLRLVQTPLVVPSSSW